MDVCGQFGDLVSFLQDLAGVEVPLLPLLLQLLRGIPLLGNPLSERGPGKGEEEQGARGDELKDE